MLFRSTASGGGSNATGSGGSSFVSGHDGAIAIESKNSTTPKSGCLVGTTDIECSKHYSSKVFTNTIIKAGNETMPTSTGTTQIGQAGNGYIQITKLGTNSQENSYKEPILNGADPILDEGMIPVIIDNNGTVKKADIKSQWYNYNNQEWANVVLVKESVRSKHKTDLKDTIIDPNNILAYLVWIPRYKYIKPTSGNTAPSTIEDRTTVVYGNIMFDH